jgi:hypothetical protein
LFKETKVFVVNCLELHYKLQHLFFGALYNQSKMQKMCCSIAQQQYFTTFVQGASLKGGDHAGTGRNSNIGQATTAGQNQGSFIILLIGWKD